ncbi:HNH endonuclease domain-containing protein [Alkalibacillus haloalkaliphilus]|uniref:HNH endonuclease domain-containing protein n=1 Tax=Alkalibacillus haloalkaliphilus TaxID=94136 RepID=UPI0029359430|nr:HNH endonuclease domain-containing protein [Alkalibacillus haloalkaliphilus]MDV2581371.1 HNH endonuclease domain-containing protein [Alkalibacillus haloalkaliphilus]
MGHKLKVGELKESYLTDEDIWRVFTNVLSNKSAKSSTYKYALIKSLIENLYQVNDNVELGYDQLAYAFAKIYWNLIVHHDLTKQNRGPKNARVVTEMKKFQSEHGIPKDFSFDKINHKLQLKLVSKVKSVMKENVFGALWGDTKGLFYEFDHKREYFRFQPAVREFMMKYQRLLVNLTNYHMAKMVEELNEYPSTQYLLEKVESIAKRGTLKPFERILLSYFEAECFYCGKDLTKSNRSSHVDHFIPWSFVQSDQIWNLVLACGACNSSKSDKLPERGYLETIINRNDHLKKSAEDDSTLLLRNYHDQKIILLYDYSIKNGFDDIWLPK